MTPYKEFVYYPGLVLFSTFWRVLSFDQIISLSFSIFQVEIPIYFGATEAKLAGRLVSPATETQRLVTFG